MRTNGSKKTAKDKVAFDNIVQEKRDGEDWKGLLAVSRKRAKARPSDPDGWLYLGFALHKLGRNAEAISPLLESQRRSGEGIRSLATLYLVLAFAAIGRTDEALAMVKQIAEDPNKRHMALSLKAEVLVLGNRHSQAAEALVELLESQSFYASPVERNVLFDSIRNRPDLKRALMKAKASKKKFQA